MEEVKRRLVPGASGWARLPGFPDACRRIGFVELWAREGPPDLGRRVEAGRYVWE